MRFQGQLPGAWRFDVCADRCGKTSREKRDAAPYAKARSAALEVKDGLLGALNGWDRGTASVTVEAGE